MMSLFRSRKRRPPPAMTLEGALGPNGRLDAAAGLSVGAPDALAVAADGRLLFSAGAQVMALDGWGSPPVPFAGFDAPVTALAASPSGRVAVGLAGGRVQVLDHGGETVDGWALAAGRLVSVVDCAFRGEDELVLADCGYAAGEEVLARASWDDEPRGQVVALSRAGGTGVVASGLHCPMSVCLAPDGSLLISQLERASIVDARRRVLREGLPGYAARLRRTPDGYAMALLSRRDPLVEFLKTEPAFVAQMKARIDPRHWIAPRLSAEFSHDFPIELGATRLFGEVKPWAPSFSYGLLVTLDDDLVPTGSAQSLANGRRHAISDAVSWKGQLIAVSKASGEIVNLGAMA